MRGPLNRGHLHIPMSNAQRISTSRAHAAERSRKPTQFAV